MSKRYRQRSSGSFEVVLVGLLAVAIAYGLIILYGLVGLYFLSFVSWA